MTVPYDPRVDRIVDRIGRRPLAFTEDGELDVERSLQQRQDRFAISGAEIDLAAIPFPDLEYYDYEHGTHTMMLATTVARDIIGITNKNELDAVKVAALFHDVGRKEVWQRPDPMHAIRSADAALAYLQLKNAPTSLIERACKLIAMHSLSGDPPGDPLLKALWDADSLEAARFTPNRSPGRTELAKRRRRMCTEWAARTDTAKIWMRKRGWE